MFDEVEADDVKIVDEVDDDEVLYVEHLNYHHQLILLLFELEGMILIDVNLGFEIFVLVDDEDDDLLIIDDIEVIDEVEVEQVDLPITVQK